MVGASCAPLVALPISIGSFTTMRIDVLHSRLEYMTMLSKDKAKPTMSLSTQAKNSRGLSFFSFLGFRTLGIGQFKISTLWKV
jgi:hypothetical protein